MYIADIGLHLSFTNPRMLICVFISRRISSNKADTFLILLTLDVNKMLDSEYGH